MLKTMKFTDHIELEDSSGQCLLTVRDYELFDFLDDFFVERNIEATIIHPPASTGAPARYQFLFPLAVSQASIYRHLSGIGVEEIERIFRINNA